MMSNGYRERGYSPSPSPRYSGEPSHKLSHISGEPHSNESSPMSLTHQDNGRTSPVPRRKQARPRRRSGDSVNSSLDLSKAGSPPLTYTKSPNSVGEHENGPQNLSIRRSHSPGHAPPAINLVKMEQLVEDRERRMEDNISDGSLERDRDCDSKPHHEGDMGRPALSNGIHHLQEQEALQALNFMASGGGLPHPLLPPPVHSPMHPGMAPHLPPSHFSPMLHKPPTSLAPTSSNSSYMENPHSTHSPLHPIKAESGLEYQRISIDRSKLSEDEAFEHAIEMIQSRQMGFRKAADFFQVSKWKLYKTARKRGIYAEIKKQNQAHALSKVPTNVAHFAELGVYKQMRKKLPGTEKEMFPHLPRQTYPLDEDAKLMKTFNISNNNNSSINNNISSANNNNIPLKPVFDKRDITFDKRYQEPIK